MINIDLSNQDIYTDNASLFQWDYGQSLVISGLTVTGDVQVHFARKNTDAEIRMGTYADSKITVAIPDVILQKSGVFHAYIYLTDGTSGETVKVINMNVRERERPTDYTSEPYVDVVNQLNSKLNQIIATGIAHYEPDPSIVDALVQAKLDDVLGNMAMKNLVAKTDLETALVSELDGKINSSKITTTLAPTQTGFIHDAKIVGEAITSANNNLANRWKSIFSGGTVASGSPVTFSAPLPLPATYRFLAIRINKSSTNATAIILIPSFMYGANTNLNLFYGIEGTTAACSLVPASNWNLTSITISFNVGNYITDAYLVY